jgi:hypothetical protein
MLQYPDLIDCSQSGSITADKLEGPMAGKQLTDLVTTMSNRVTYINKIKMEKIRGQITSSQQ